MAMIIVMAKLRIFFDTAGALIIFAKNYFMMKRILLALISLAVLLNGYAVQPKETYVFDVIGGDSLRLDFYRANADKPTPVLIFAFGGAFMHGQRDDARYIPFFEFLADNGVSVVSTDYRTKLKGIHPSDVSSMQELADRLNDAVSSAVTDFFKATAFTAAHAKEWNINPEQIFACGSSAGAITVLQAETELCNATSSLPGFPANFNYAGVVSFAGAVFCYGEPYWRKTPAPMLLFHGNADSNVPFRSATIESFGLWGSEAISEELAEAGHPVWFHRVDGADHSIAISPMDENAGEVLDFIHAVLAGKLKARTIVEESGRKNYRTDFSIEDYLISNLN